jgi:transposase
MRKNSRRLALTFSERSALEDLLNRPSQRAGLVQRARMILLCADGINQRAIARQLGCHFSNVQKWIKRWLRGGIEALYDGARCGRPPKMTDAQVKRIVTTVCRKPPSYLSRWSVRTLARELQLPASTVHEVLQAQSLHPHHLRTFTFSPDPHFEDKLLEVVGLYMNPPENAVVLCVDEKTGIQALERTQAVLPLQPQQPRSWTNEYVRHGTKTVLAALNIATGEVHAHIKNQRRSKEFLAFMDDVAARNKKKRLCVIMDNLNTHTNAAAQEWLKKHPTITFHYTPTHASWVNLIECFFSILTKQGLQQSVHTSTKQLAAFLKTFIREYNKRCGPFTWTKGPEKLRKIITLTKRFQKGNSN